MEHILSFIPEDHIIRYNGSVYNSDTFTPISKEHAIIKAVHWTPKYKHVEFTTGSYKELSTDADYKEYVFPYVLKVNEYINKTAAKILDINNEEFCAAQIRAFRNRYLKDTDFALLSDAPYSDTEIAAIKKYRQELRDLTKKQGFPWTGTPLENIPWPVNPINKV